MGWLLLAALLLTALVLVALGVALVMLRGVQRRRRTFTISDATIDDAWTRWIDGRELSDAERTLRAALLELLDPPTLAAVLADLRRLETETVAARAPLVAVREEIMASVDRRMLNTEILRLSDAQRAEVRARSSDALQSDGDARRYIAANEWRLHVLREYAALRYGDKAANDWFAVYERAAQLKRASVRAFLERSLAGDDADPRESAIRTVDQELKRRLLQLPPGAQFRGQQPAGTTAA
jgi:hypothetical protein